MSLSIPLLVVLVTVNVVTVLCLLLSARTRRRIPVAEAALPVTEAVSAETDEPLQNLIDQVESATEFHGPRSSGEAGLEEALKRWRRSGNNAPPPADSCRLEHTA